MNQGRENNKELRFKSVALFTITKTLSLETDNIYGNFQVIYQTRGRVFPPISKHREVG